jgi:ArsR family transcriptional regulator
VQLMLRAMADPQRYRILRILASSNCGPETSCVSLLENLGLSQPTLSHHMKELRLAGLVKQKRNGRTTRYYLNRSIVQRFCEELIDQLLQG